MAHPVGGREVELALQVANSDAVVRVEKDARAVPGTRSCGRQVGAPWLRVLLAADQAPELCAAGGELSEGAAREDLTVVEHDDFICLMHELHVVGHEERC